MTPIKSSPKKGTPLLQVSRRCPGYGRCWDSSGRSGRATLSRAPYGPELLEEVPPVPVQEEGSGQMAPFPSRIRKANFRPPDVI